MGESDPAPLPTLDTDCNSTRTANLAPPSPADSAGGGGGRGDIPRAPLVAAVGGHGEDVRTTFDERAHRPLGSADIPPDGAPIDLPSAPLLEIDDAGPQEPPPPTPIALPTPAPTPPPPASSPALPTVRVLPGPTYPQLSNNPPSSPGTRLPLSDDKDEEPSVPKSFDRTVQSGGGGGARQKYYEEAETAEYAVRRMHRFTLYETTTRYYIVGSDLLDQQFRIIKIDRTAEEGELSIIEDEVIYTRAEMMRLLATIEDGNIATGGLKQRCPFWGLLGFIRFTGMYYMLLITKRSVVAMIGGHYVYQIDDTEMVPLTTSAAPKKPDRNSEEARFVSILGNLDLTRGFYFSYSYDITRTLQHNIIRQREALEKGLAHSDKHDYNDMFAWNHYLLEPAKEGIKNTYDWCMPIVHGYVDQANIAVYGRSLYITIIARRSRYFAGARFLKRGANDLGYVANDVETEQIVSEMLTTSFHAPGRTLYANPNYTSYVQHRGSIPLFWTQKNDAATPKPPVEMNLVDPFFSAAALHFDDLFGRYGAPVIVLNLVKSRERMPRESLLLKEFTQAINYLNQFLPDDKHIHYIAWDMSRAAKSRDQDVIETLETIAENVVSTTGFFHNGAMNGINRPKLQNGVCRTNCIDCLDRTNAAQFVIGKRALGHQLHALGVIDGTSINYDTDAVDLFTHMYHDHGDTIAVQYAGSHLVNTMETYRKINQWSSHSRDMLESFKRYYNNSFLGIGAFTPSCPHRLLTTTVQTANDKKPIIYFSETTSSRKASQCSGISALTTIFTTPTHASAANAAATRNGGRLRTSHPASSPAYQSSRPCSPASPTTISMITGSNTTAPERSPPSSRSSPTTSTALSDTFLSSKPKTANTICPHSSSAPPPRRQSRTNNPPRRNTSGAGSSSSRASARRPKSKRPTSRTRRRRSVTGRCRTRP